MKTFRIKMVPKNGGSITFAILQGYSRAAMWNIAATAYPAFNILNIEDVK